MTATKRQTSTANNKYNIRYDACTSMCDITDGTAGDLFFITVTHSKGAHPYA